MPQRALNLVLALAGVVAVLGVIVIGFDLHRVSTSGPRWRRRLLAAGLALLGLAAPPSCISSTPTCYAVVEQGKAPLSWLEAQLPLLEQAARTGVIDDQTVVRSLEAVEEELSELDRLDREGALTAQVRHAYAGLRPTAVAAVSRIRQFAATRPVSGPTASSRPQSRPAGE